MDKISYIKEKSSGDEYSLNDIDAVKHIYYGNTETGYEEAENNEGEVKIPITVLKPATASLLGGVYISDDEDVYNITKENGYLKAIVPIKKISDADGKEFSVKSSEEFNIVIPKAAVASYGLVKAGTGTILIDSYGVLYNKFGKSYTKDGTTVDKTFNTIYEEETDLDFSANKSLFAFEEE